MRAAAALRLALLVDLALQVYIDVMTDKGHPQRVAVARDVLERNNLTGYGAPAKDKGLGQSLTVQTQVNMPEARFAAMSDADLEAYDRLLTELRELLPKDEPKRNWQREPMMSAAGDDRQKDVGIYFSNRVARGTPRG